MARTGTPVEKLGRVASTGPHIPVNGRPTVVFVDAIWCPFCALARSELQAVRPDYEGQINFIVLDYDLPEDLRLARALGIAGHPTFAILPPGSDGTEVSDRRFGPLPRATLRAAFDQALGS